MKNFYNKLLPVMLLCLCLSGCRQDAPSPTPLNLVASVQVDYEHNNVHLQRIYTDTNKMDAVLYYLYSLSSYPPGAGKTPGIDGQYCKITVTMSDGQEHIYHQLGGLYLSVDDRPWKRIDPKKSKNLFSMLARMNSDL